MLLGGCQGVVFKDPYPKCEPSDPWNFPKCKKLFEINIK